MCEIERADEDNPADNLGLAEPERIYGKVDMTDPYRGHTG